MIIIEYASFINSVRLSTGAVETSWISKERPGQVLSFDSDSRFLRLESPTTGAFDLIPLTNISILTVRKPR